MSRKKVDPALTLDDLDAALEGVNVIVSDLDERVEALEDDLEVLEHQFEHQRQTQGNEICARVALDQRVEKIETALNRPDPLSSEVSQLARRVTALETVYADRIPGDVVRNALARLTKFENDEKFRRYQIALIDRTIGDMMARSVAGRGFFGRLRWLFFGA